MCSLCTLRARWCKCEVAIRFWVWIVRTFLRTLAERMLALAGYWAHWVAQVHGEVRKAGLWAAHRTGHTHSPTRTHTSTRILRHTHARTHAHRHTGTQTHTIVLAQESEGTDASIETAHGCQGPGQCKH